MADEEKLGRFGLSLKEHDMTRPLSWQDCEDLEIYDNGTLVYAGPRYFRCSRHECNHLVTHGMVKQGGCWCGNRRLIVPMRLKAEEKALLKRGYYPLVAWEIEAINPSLPTNQEVTGWGKAEWQRRNS